MILFKAIFIDSKCSSIEDLAMEVGRKKGYFFLTDYELLIGDYIRCPEYTTPMQVVAVVNTAYFDTSYNGVNLKYLEKLDSIEHISNHTGIRMNASLYKVYASRKGCADSSAYKELMSDSITTTDNSHSIKVPNKTNNNMKFNNLIETYKAQFIPVKEENVRLTMNGQIAVPDKEGNYIAMDTEFTKVPAELCIEFPCFSILKPVAQVAVGDTVKVGDVYARVSAKKNGSLTLLGVDGNKIENTPIKDFFIKQSLVRVILNLAAGFTGDNTASFNPMMLAFLGDKDSNNDALITMMMAQGTNNMPNGFNPMMLALLDKSDNSSMLEKVMLMQAMGGMFNNPTNNIDK